MAAAMSGLAASDAALFVRRKCRDLRVSALSGVKRVSCVRFAPESGHLMKQSAAARMKVGTLSGLLCPS
jgi:hypothetical protein